LLYYHINVTERDILEHLDNVINPDDAALKFHFDPCFYTAAYCTAKIATGGLISFFLFSFSPGTCSARSVAMYQGDTQLTRMLSFALHVHTQAGEKKEEKEKKWCAQSQRGPGALGRKVQTL